MRRLMWTASALVFIVGVQLFVFSDSTERFFAWTIQPPLTAAFLGAAYWASCALEVMAARQVLWARARAAVPAVFVFTVLTFIATLVHIDRFHLASTQPPETILLTWVWIGVYALVPPALLIAWIVQLRAPGGDPPAQQPIHIAARGVMALQAALMAALGAMLFFAPQATLGMWPWPLTPLTARAIGAWLLGLGIAAAQVMLENEWHNARPVTVSCIVFTLLQFVALARYAQHVSWDSASAWAYLVFLISLLAVGAYGLFVSQQALALEKRYAQ
jgi:hypothetical protein